MIYYRLYDVDAKEFSYPDYYDYESALNAAKEWLAEEPEARIDLCYYKYKDGPEFETGYVKSERIEL